MAFRLKPLAQAAPGLFGVCGRACRSTVLLITRFVLSLALLAVLAAGLFYARLAQGPLELPVLGRLAAEQLNASQDGHGVEIGSVVVDLAAGDGLSAVQLLDVTVTDPDGAAMFNLPRVVAELGLADLLHGRVSPERITVKAPDVVLTRAKDGHLHLQVGQGEGVALAPGRTDAATGNALETVLAQLVGEIPSMDAVRALEAVRINGARLVYSDEILGQSWESRGAGLELVKFEGGARAIVRADVIDLPGRGAAVQMVAERYKGQKDLHVIASFGQISTSVIAAQTPGLEWLSVLEGTVEGRATAIVDPGGQVTALGGTIFAEQGRLKGWGADGTFDTAEISFLIDPARDMVRLEQAVLSSNALDTSMYGMAKVSRDADGNVAGLTGELAVERIYARLPKLFAEPIAFDSGEINFAWGLAENEIAISETTLRAGKLAFHLDGKAVEAEHGWDTEFSAKADGMDINGLLAHWPLATAKNARDWVAEHITKADIPEFSAQMRIGKGEPELALAFRFRDLNSRYLDNMSPIRGAAGRGKMTYNDLYLDFDRAQVTPSGHRPIALGGSTVAITDFWEEVTPADIKLKAKGDTKAILALIDEKPLALVSKLGIDLGAPGGTATVNTQVDFPLIAALRLDQVKADASATFQKFGLDLELAERAPLNITGNGLKLQADTKGLKLAGNVKLDGIPARIEWSERYSGAKQGRTVGINGRTSPRLMEMLGASDIPIEGQAPFSLDLAQRGDGPVDFDLDMNLGPTTLEIPDIDWRKRQGAKGRLTAKGRAGDSIAIESFGLSAAGLVAEGSLEIGSEGGLTSARFDRLVIPDLADVRGRVRTGADGVMEVTLTGGQVDLSGQMDRTDDANDSAAGDPFRVSFVLDRMLLTEKLVLWNAKGDIARTAAGALGGSINGSLAGKVLLSLQLTRAPEGGGKIVLQSADAGAVLEAADLYRGAKGGRLLVDARIGAGAAPDLSGTARIEDISVRSERTFRRVLRQGGLDDAEQQVTTSGLGFRKIWIPFVYDDGLLTLTDAIATSSALALKVNGTLDEESEALDLSGVMSPAYALTGALNEVPVLGTLLSGGEGEGILAMTFTLSGPARDPDLSVNPLSILAPGFLRNIFRRDNAPADGSFRERVKPGNDQ